MVKGLNLNWKKRSNLISLALVLAVLGVLGWLVGSRLDLDDPFVEIPGKLTALGPKTSTTLKAGDRSSGLKSITVTVKQGEGPEKTVLSRTFPPGGEAGLTVEIPLTLDPQGLGLKDGKARLSVTATDRSWGNLLRGRRTLITRDLEVELTPLTVTFVAASHLNQAGGTALVVYRVNKPPKETGLRMGDQFFPGYPVPKGQPEAYGVLVPLPLDCPAGLPVELVARGAGGSEAKQSHILKVKPRKWRHDKMNLSEGFLRQVAAVFPDAAQGDLLQTFLEVNRKKRQANHDRVREISAQSQPQPQWQGAFYRYPGKAMARFGDRRTYVFQNRTVDEQVHYGEDLASLTHSPVPAGNRGTVVLAEPLGIYGNTVILDHGLGLFSMYSHLSQMAVKAGDRVDKGQILGRTGATGLAGGDHLHFSIIVHGRFVNPIEWWDPHWLRDQVEKVWAQAGVPAVAAAPAPKPTPPATRSKSKRSQRGR